MTVLYTGTDSVIYVSGRGDWEPQLGTVLGEWNNEMEDGESHIVSFISLGPKTYAYETDTGRIEMKIKSITQNGHTEDLLKRQDGQRQKTGHALNKQTLHHLLDNKYLKRNAKTQKIFEVELGKTLRLVYDKRILF